MPTGPYGRQAFVMSGNWDIGPWWVGSDIYYRLRHGSHPWDKSIADKKVAIWPKSESYDKSKYLTVENKCDTAYSFYSWPDWKQWHDWEWLWEVDHRPKNPWDCPAEAAPQPWGRHHGRKWDDPPHMNVPPSRYYWFPQANWIDWLAR